MWWVDCIPSLCATCRILQAARNVNSPVMSWLYTVIVCHVSCLTGGSYCELSCDELIVYCHCVPRVVSYRRLMCTLLWWVDCILSLCATCRILQAARTVNCPVMSWLYTVIVCHVSYLTGDSCALSCDELIVYRHCVPRVVSYRRLVLWTVLCDLS